MNTKKTFLVGLQAFITHFHNQGWPYIIGFIARRLIITLIVLPAALCFGLQIALTSGKPFTNAAEVYVEALQEYSTYPGIGHETIIKKVCAGGGKQLDKENIKAEFACNKFEFESEDKKKAIDDLARELAISYSVLVMLSFIVDFSIIYFKRTNRDTQVPNEDNDSFKIQL